MISNCLRSSKLGFLVSSVLLVTLCAAVASAQSKQLPTPKIFAQKLVNDTLAAHSELRGLEISAASARKDECTTIASDEAEGIGEKCDQEEYHVMKTNTLDVDLASEDGKEFYDVNVPIHDSTGKILAVVGIDFRSGKEMTAAQVHAQAEKIAKEIEAQVPTRDKLYEPVK